jgi:hypothetical protein
LLQASYFDFDNFQIVNTDFLSAMAWQHQMAYHEMQTEVDSAIAEINSLIALVLVDNTNSAISQYSSHATEVYNVYNPVHTQAQALADSECKTDTFTLLDYSVLSSGTMSGNCITSFNRNVDKEVDAAREVLSKFNIDFGQLVLNVYRSHAKYNIMTEAENVEANLNATFAQTSADWAAIRPEVDTLRNTLSASVAALATRLGQCFTNAYTYANTMVSTIQIQINECNEFNSYVAAKAGAKLVRSFQSHMSELEQMINDFQFEW